MAGESSSQHHPKCRRRRTGRGLRMPVAVEHASYVVIGLLMLDTVHAQTAPSARWGQASAVSNNTLYIQGGKVDPSNSYSYSSAPNTNDLYSLDLSSTFPITTPPWTYLSGSSDASSSQGPSVAFHTLTPYSNTEFLAFGGDGGPSLPIQTNNDSAWTLTACGTCQASWTQEPADWVGEPMRRMYHSAAASSSEVWITGGQKADGSGLGFSDTYAFSGTSFMALEPSSSIPPDLVGHRSVYLPNGFVVVLGGYSTSWATLIPLSTLYILDTLTSPPLWMNATVLGGQAPLPRRNFALALLDGNKLLIHGGGDATLQNMYSDGAILDLTVTPMSWVSAPALTTALGARVDHTAVGIGSDVFFALGRGANGPAPAALQLYDSVQDTFLDTFTPSSGNGGSDGNGGSNGNGGSHGHGEGKSATIVLPTGTQGYTTGVDWPTTRVTGLIPGQSYPPTTGVPQPTTGVPQPTNSDNNDNSVDPGAHERRIAAIAVGTILGVLAGLALGIALVYWCLRRRSRGILLGVPLDRRHLIQSSGDTGGDPESAVSGRRGKIPVAGGPWQEEQPKRLFFGVLPIPFSRGSSSRERFDMLHDEDARSFRQQHHGSGNKGSSLHSSINGGPPVRPRFGRMGSSGRNLWDGVWNKSTTSFKAALGLGMGGFGYTNSPSTEKHSPDWWEKRRDPFADDAVALADVPSVTAVGMSFANRKLGSSHVTSDSFGSSATAYRDPFRDASFGSHSRGSTSTSTGQLYGDVPPTESWQPFVVPKFASAGYMSPPLSPVQGMEELGAHPGLPWAPESGSGSGSGTSDATHYSLSSGDLKGSPSTPHPPMSLIGSAPVTPIKRTDSWWNRFGRSSLGSKTPGAVSPIRRLSLRNSFAGSKEGYINLDFRDPNPPPRLEGIEETGKSNDPSPSTPESLKARRLASGAAVGKKPSHSKSTSSFQTMQTADSAALERIGGRVDVLQRGRQGSSETNTPEGSMFEEGEGRRARLVLMNHVSSPDGSEHTDRPSLLEKTSSSTNTTGHHHELEPWSPPITSPTSGTQETFQTAATHLSHASRPSPGHPHNSDESFKSALSSIPPPPKAPPKRRVTSGVAARVALFDHIAENSPSTTSLPLSPTGITGFHIPPASPPAMPAASLIAPSTPPKSPTPMSLAMLPRVQTGPVEERRPSTTSDDKRKSEMSEKRRSSVNVQYGLKERPPLFVANPDKSNHPGAEPSG